MQQFQVLVDSFHNAVDDPFIEGLVWVYSPSGGLSVWGGHTFSLEQAQARSRIDWARQAGFNDAEIWQYQCLHMGNAYNSLRSGPTEISASSPVGAATKILAGMKELV